MHIRSKDLTGWLRMRVTATGADGLLVPFTGSVQAAVVARLCQSAVPDAVIAVIAVSDSGERARARTIAEQLQLPIVEVNAEGAAALVNELGPALDRFRRRRDVSPDRALLQSAMSSRVEMAAIHFVAELLNYLVAGTLDRTDLTLGAFARYGESSVDLLPLGNALRSEVVALAVDLDLPPGLIEQCRRPEDTRDGGLGFTPENLEEYLADGPDAVAPAVALKIERLMRHSERKRAAAETPEPE